MGLPGYTDEIVSRATDFKLAWGKSVRVCCAEDLIIHKCVAGRPQDLRDIEGVIARQHALLDVEYIHKWLREFANELSNSKVLDRFERAWRSVHVSAARRTVKRSKRKR